MKKLIEYKSSDLYKDGICCLVFTLNNEKDIKDCLASLKNSKFDQLILTDGGSIDDTVAIAKSYVDRIVISPKGFIIQAKNALEFIQFKYLIGIEADHRYPHGFVEQIVDSLKKGDFAAIQPRLRCALKRNYFEKGLAELYCLLQPNAGETGFVSGPVVTYTELYSDFVNQSNLNGASIDTGFSQTLSSNELKMGLDELMITQYEPFGLIEWYKKFYWYGQGDGVFYSKESPFWTVKRKILSLSHPLRKYIITLPVATMRRGNIHLAPFFIISAIFRYIGWTSYCVNNFFTQKKY